MASRRPEAQKSSLTATRQTKQSPGGVIHIRSLINPSFFNNGHVPPPDATQHNRAAGTTWPPEQAKDCKARGGEARGRRRAGGVQESSRGSLRYGITATTPPSMARPQALMAACLALCLQGSPVDGHSWPVTSQPVPRRFWTPRWFLTLVLAQDVLAISSPCRGNMEMRAPRRLGEGILPYVSLQVGQPWPIDVSAVPPLSPQFPLTRCFFRITAGRPPHAYLLLFQFSFTVLSSVPSLRFPGGCLDVPHSKAASTLPRRVS